MLETFILQNLKFKNFYKRQRRVFFKIKCSTLVFIFHNVASIDFLAMEKLRLKESLEKDLVPKYVKLSQLEEKSIIKNNEKDIF